MAEANFFREKLNEATKKQYENQNEKLFEVGSYYSAYLSASNSVYDYVLNYANKVFKLGLTDEQYWDNKKFRKVAEEKNNTDALEFIKWFDSRIELEKGMSIGKAFAKCRRINTHKRNTFKIAFDPKITKIGKNPDGTPDPESILMDPNIFLVVEGFENMKIDDACDTHYSTLETFVKDANETIGKIHLESHTIEL